MANNNGKSSWYSSKSNSFLDSVKSSLTNYDSKSKTRNSNTKKKSSNPFINTLELDIIETDANTPLPSTLKEDSEYFNYDTTIDPPLVLPKSKTQIPDQLNYAIHSVRGNQDTPDIDDLNYINQREGTRIKNNVVNALSKNYAEIDIKHLFDGIDDDTIEKNIPIAHETVKNNIEKGILNSDMIGKLSNIVDGLTMFFAASDSGKSKAAKKAYEVAYTEDTTNENSQDTNNQEQPENQEKKFLNSDFYDDFVSKNKSSQDDSSSWHGLGSKGLDSPEDIRKGIGGSRYVSADSLNMRSQPGLDSEVVGKLVNGTEVKYTGNKTEEIDGHLWAEVTYNGNKGWVAADYLKTSKPQAPTTNQSVPTSSVPKVPTPNVTVDPGSKIDYTDHKALQEAFAKIRKPGATADDPGEPGDFDGKEGLQCPDVVKWFLDTFTTLKWEKGNGCVQVYNTVQTNKLPKDAIINDPNKVTVPAIFSVEGQVKELGASGTKDAGHTGIVLEIDRKNNEMKILHTWSGCNSNGYNSSVRSYPIPKGRVTYLNLSDYIKHK